jgi:hypothetical protein
MKLAIKQVTLKQILLLCLKRALKDPAVGKFLREELYEMQNDWTDYTRNNVVEWLSEDHLWLATYFKKGNNLRINRMHDGHNDSAWWEKKKAIAQHNEISLLLSE